VVSRAEVSKLKTNEVNSYEFPVDEPNGTCEERTQAAFHLAQHKANGNGNGSAANVNSSSGASAADPKGHDTDEGDGSSGASAANPKGHDADEGDGSSGASAANAKGHDAQDNTTIPLRKNGKRKGDGSSGASAANAKSRDAQDNTTVQRLIKQLVEGIQEVMNEDVSPAAPERLGDSLAQYHHKQRLADDGGQLEEMLWKTATDVESGAKESAWMHRIMFSVCRCYRRVKQMEILVDPDPAIETKQKRWEVGGQVLNEIVDRLYASRKELALVVFRAARSKYPRCVVLLMR
jgi:hypothetical protein